MASRFDMRPDDASNRALLAAVRPPDWIQPKADDIYDLVVVGAGTAGLVAAAGAAGVGARVALVEERWMGGDCLNVGCVPSKAVIASARVADGARRAHQLGVQVSDVNVDFAAAMERMREVRAGIAPVDGAARFRDLGVDVFLGSGRFTSKRTLSVNGVELRFARAVIATGARPRAPQIDGLDERGYLTNETVFELTERPRRLVVIGGGPIGCELAQAFARLGSRVVLLDAGERILSRDDADAAAVVEAALRRDGVEITCDAGLERVEADGTVRYRVRGAAASAPSSMILVATGRTPNTAHLALDAASVETDARGRIRVDDRLRSTNKRIYAAGDVASPWQFTHAADAMARMVIRNALFFGRQKVGDLLVPRVTYTDPELAHVGLTGELAAEQGVEVDTFTRSFSEVDRALTDGATEGFARLHLRRGTDRIVGASIVGAHAGELISEVVVAMRANLGAGALADVIHPYPTRALALKQLGDQYNRTRLTPMVRWLLGWILKWRRR